jgi:predicted amidophosphoribosyltransferase
MQHFMEWPEVVRATAYFNYYKEGRYSKLIHALKYHDQPEIGIFLGRLAVTELRASGFFEGLDLIIPIPLSKKRLRKRRMLELKQKQGAQQMKRSLKISKVDATRLKMRWIFIKICNNY